MGEGAAEFKLANKFVLSAENTSPEKKKTNKNIGLKQFFNDIICQYYVDLLKTDGLQLFSDCIFAECPKNIGSNEQNYSLETNPYKN
jgi:hypothetical protein